MRFQLPLVFLALSACANYDVTLNEKVVYSPPRLFMDFSFADKALQNCVEQTITDQHITKPEQLTRLICTNGEIKNVKGIELFTELRQLNLSNNLLQNIDTLARLPVLQNLALTANKVKTVLPLVDSAALLKLDVRNNAMLNCLTAIELMNQLPALQVQMPAHCDGKLK